MRKIGKKLTEFMSDLNIGLFFVSIFSIMTTNFVYGATCETANTGSCAVKDYSASNCDTTSTLATYYIKGQSGVCYSSCDGPNCKAGYQKIIKTIKTGDCTFAMKDCLPQKSYAVVAAICDGYTGSDLYESVCKTLGKSDKGKEIIAEIDPNYLSTTKKKLYSGGYCGTYNIIDPEDEKPKDTKTVIMCFQNEIAVDSQYVSGETMANALASPCNNACGATSIETDWSGYLGDEFAITNYALWKCCYDGGCSGYIDYSTLTNNPEAQWAALKCCNSTTGACSTTSGKGKLRCSPGYYNNKGIGDYTVTMGGYGNNLTKIDCVSCAEKTGDSKATSDAGSAAITDCYVESGYTGTNIKGSFQYPSSRCYYTND